jgi:uncharacterized UBP type Zn finger protein
VVANQYKTDVKRFEAQAKAWVQEYALINPEDLKVKQLTEMGFEEAKCRIALDKAGGDVAAAAEFLFTM